MMTVGIQGIGTAVPEHVVDQRMVRSTVERVFGGRVADLDRLLSVFEHDHIHTRRFVCDPAWYAEDHGFAQTNHVYASTAADLAERAARAACQGIDQEIAAVVVVSTTGIMTPSLDATLIQRLGLSPHTLRIPIFGLGCAGGVAGLARAADLSRACNGAPVLFVAVEICSVTFRQSDTRTSNIVASSIFGDGAAAVVVSAQPHTVALGSGISTLFSDTSDIMGWDVTNEGLSVRFSRDIPSFVRSHIPDVLSHAYRQWGVTADDVSAIIAHPGGAKVLDAYAEAASMPTETFAHAREVLRTYGNMSSASVLFVLDRWYNDPNRQQRGYAVMAALGPGFSSELLLLGLRDHQRDNS